MSLGDFSIVPLVIRLSVLSQNTISVSTCYPLGPSDKQILTGGYSIADSLASIVVNLTVLSNLAVSDPTVC